MKKNHFHFSLFQHFENLFSDFCFLKSLRIPFNRKKYFKQFFIFLFVLFGSSQLRVQAQFSGSILSGNLEACKGGLVTIQITNNQTSSVSLPIKIKLNNFSGYTVKDTILSVLHTSQTGTALTITKLAGTFNYQISGSGVVTSIPQNVSIFMNLWVYPPCSRLANMNTDPVSDTAHIVTPIYSPSTSTTPFNLISFGTFNIAFPSIHVFSNYNLSDTVFRPAWQPMSTLCYGAGCNSSTFTCNDSVSYIYQALPNLFYRKASVRNSMSSSLDLSKKGTKLILKESHDATKIPYYVRAIHYKDSYGWHRIQRKNVNSPSPWSNSPNDPLHRVTITVDSSVVSAVIISFKFDSVLLNLMTGKPYMDTSSKLTFWIESSLIRDGKSYCGNNTEVTWSSTYNCFKDTSSTCINQISTKYCVNILGTPTNVTYVNSGIYYQDVCYSRQTPSNSQFGQHLSKYFMLIKNNGHNSIKDLIVKFLNEIGPANQNTHYLFSNGHLHVGLYSQNPNSMMTTLGNTLTLPITNILDSFKCSVHRDTIFPGRSGIDEYFHLDSFISKTGGGSLAIDSGKYLLLLWDGYTKLPSKNCSIVNKERDWKYQFVFDDVCTGGINSYGGDWGQNDYFVTTTLSTSVGSLIGPYLAQIVGNHEDDYHDGPSGTFDYTIPNFTTPTQPILLPSDSDVSFANQAILIKITLGNLLNFWKGDFHNKNHLCSIDSSAYYSPSHLLTSIRFITKNNRLIHPTSIAYENSHDPYFGHYIIDTSHTRYLPTGLNDTTDVVDAIFPLNTISLDSLSGLTVEADVQPQCNTCECLNHPHHRNSVGSQTPIGVSVYHIPCLNCDIDTIVKLPSFIRTSSKNTYSLFCQSDPVLVQCPGCKIAGLYGLKMIFSRINFGLEDFNNDRGADVSLKSILFDQRNFKAVTYTPTNVRFDKDKLMYHDLLRLKLKTIVHLDDTDKIGGTGYYPSAIKMGLPITTHTGGAETGFKYGYVRILCPFVGADTAGLPHAAQLQVLQNMAALNAQFSIKPYNKLCDNSNSGRNIQTNIPALIVWIQDGDTLPNGTYPYKTGFNSYNQATYSSSYGNYKYVSPYRHDSALVTPIVVYYNPQYDWLDTIAGGKREFVYDVSMNRLDSLYNAEYGGGLHLPMSYYHDQMKVDYDLTYQTNINVGAITDDDFVSKIDITGYAYLTKTPENKSNTKRFVSLQDASDVINASIFGDTTSHPFITTPKLLTNLCPIDSITTTALVPSVAEVPVSSCDSIRWWCVKGEAFLKVAGYVFTPRMYVDIYKSYCGFSLNNGNDWVFAVSSPFHYEYRNWAEVTRQSFYGLSANTNLISIKNYDYYSYGGGYSYNSYLLNNPSPSVLSMNYTNHYHPYTYGPSSLDSMRRFDDPMLVSSFTQDGYKIIPSFQLHQCDSIPGDSCLQIRTISRFNIADLDSSFFIHKLTSPCRNIPISLLSGNSCDSILPFITHRLGAFSERVDEQKMIFRTIGKEHLKFPGTYSGNMLNGKIKWTGVVVDNDSSHINSHVYAPGSGNNPWVAITFPPKWGTANPIDSIKINGLKLKRVPMDSVKTPHTAQFPPFSRTYVYWKYSTFPDASTHVYDYWHIKHNGGSDGTVYHNYVDLFAHYPCAKEFNTNADTIIMHVGVMCDTINYHLDSTFNTLSSNSCDRTRKGLKLSTFAPQFETVNLSSYQQPGVCANFNMIFKLANTEYDTLFNIRAMVNLPSSGGYTFSTPTPGVSGCSTGCYGYYTFGTTTTPLTISNGTYVNLPNKLLGWNINSTFNNYDVFTFGIQTHCTLSYSPSDIVKVTFLADRHCAGNTYTDTIIYLLNPILDNPNSVFNQLSPQITTPLQTTCAATDTVTFTLSNLLNLTNANISVGDTFLGAYNQLLLQLPQGYSVGNTFFGTTVLSPSNIPSSCSGTASSYFGSNSGGQHYASVNLSALSGTNILTNPIKLKVVLHVDSTAACSSLMKALVATVDSFSCSNGSQCGICASQNANPTTGTLILGTPKPTITFIDTACTGRGKCTVSGGCGHYKWYVNGTLNSSTASSITLNTGSYNVYATSRLFGSSTCVSDTSLHVRANIFNSLNYTYTKTSVSCDSANGKISVTVTSGVAPYTYAIKHGTTHISSLSHYTFSGLSVGKDTIVVTDANGCSHTVADSLVLNPICGHVNVCMGTLENYSVGLVQNAASYNWSCSSSTNSCPSPITSTNSNISVVWGSPGTAVLTVIIKDVNGTVLATKSLTVHVHRIPSNVILPASGISSCTVVETGNDTCWVYCDSNYVQFTTANIAGYSYHWIINGDSTQIISGKHSNTVTMYFYQLGSFTLTLQVTNDSANCTETVSKCIKIVPKPHARFVTLPASPGGVMHLCLNQSVTFTDSSTNASTVAGSFLNQYTWNAGNHVDSISGPYPPSPFTVAYHHAGTFRAYLAIENSCHCTDTAFITIIVDTTKGPDIFCATTICYSDTAMYSTSIMGCTNYNWSVSSEGHILETPPYPPTIHVLWNNSTSSTSGKVYLNVSGCSGYVCSDTTVVNVPILPPAALINGQITVCPNQILMYSVNNIPGTIYNWSLVGNVTPVGAITNNNYIYVKSGNTPGGAFSVYVTYSNCTIKCQGNSRLNCNISILFHIACPTGVSNCSKACANGQTTLTTSAPTNFHHFKWYTYPSLNPGNIIDSTLTATSSYTINWASLLTGANAITTPTTFTIKAYDATAAYCNPNQADYYTVTVYPVPPKPLDSVLHPFGCICPNSSISLMASAITGTYLVWNFVGPSGTTGSPSVGTGNQFSTSFSGGTWGTHYLLTLQQIMTDYPHCASDTMQFVVPACNQPSLNVHGDSIVCINSTSHLFVSPGADYYDWKLNNNSDGTIIGGQGTSQITVQWNSYATSTSYGGGSQNIKVDIYSCGIKTTVYYIVNLTVPNNIVITPNPATVCTGMPVALTVTESPISSCGVSGNFYWDFGDGSTATTASPTVSHIFSTPGTKVIQVGVQNNSTSHLLQNTSLSLTVIPGFSAAIQSSGNACPNFTLTANTTIAGTSPYSYVWYYQPVGGGGYSVISGATTSTYSATSQGIYEVQMTDANGCVATALDNNQCGGTSSLPVCPSLYSGSISGTVTPCSGNATFTFSVTPATYTSYTIDYGDNSSGTSLTHTYSSAGVYHVTLTVKFFSGTQECSNDITSIVTIPLVISNAVTFKCTPALNGYVHDLSTVYPTGTITYTGWGIVPTSPTLTNTGSVETATPLVAGTTYTVSYLVNTTCPATATFTAPPLPTAAYTPIPTGPVCEGTPVEFKDNSTPTGHIINCSWNWIDRVSPLNLISSNTQNPFEAFNYDASSSPLGKVNIAQTITDDHLCQNNTTGLYFVKQNTLGNLTLVTSGPNCFGTADILTAHVFPNPTTATLHYNFIDTFFKANGGGNNTVIGINNPVTSAVNTFNVLNSGNYYVKVRDAYGCSSSPSSASSPSFINTPPAVISGPTIVCQNQAADFGMFIGSNYNYQWTISPAVGGLTLNSADLHIPAGVLSGGTNYTLTGTISNPSTPFCPQVSSYSFTCSNIPHVNAPTIPIYCLANGGTANIVMSASGGAMPYTYSLTGNTSNVFTTNAGGHYIYYVIDAHGCQSNNQQFADIAPAPNFSTLITGCFEACDSFVICPASDPNYPVATWYLGNQPVPSYMVLSSGNLNPTQSGIYYLQLCNASLSCCAMSPPININILNCNNCCSHDSAYIDSLVCIGKNGKGLMQYLFRIKYRDACSFNDSLALHVSNGIISNVSTTSMIPGWNTIYGIFVDTSFSGFCPSIQTYRYDSHLGRYVENCDVAINCMEIPDCVSLPSCNYNTNFQVAVCDHIDPRTGYPIYKIVFDITNPNGTPVSYTLSSPQGSIIWSSNPSNILNPGNTPINILFEDTPSFDGYICLVLTIQDPNIGICQQTLCFPLNVCPQITQHRCPIEAKIVDVQCDGYDSNGNPQFMIIFDYFNMLGTNNVILSVLSPTGTVNQIFSIAPPYLSGPPIRDTFIYTDMTTMGNGMGCFGFMLTDTLKQLSCYIDYTMMPDLCVQLIPGCPNVRLAHHSNSNSSNLNSAINSKNESDNCLVRIIPNPNEGKPEVYYKIDNTLSDAQALNFKDLRISIVETETGKTVYLQQLNSPIGVIYWLEKAPLKDGHYTVILWNSAQRLCTAKMEVVHK